MTARPVKVDSGVLSDGRCGRNDKSGRQSGDIVKGGRL